MTSAPRRALGSRIRALRKRAGISQEALADLAKLDRTYIGGIERGERNPSFDNLMKVARALGVSISILLQGVDSDEGRVGRGPASTDAEQ